MTGNKPISGVLLGWALSIPFGALAGFFFRWWISGLPCYLLAGYLLLRNVQRYVLAGVFCGSLAAAATQGMGVQMAPLVLVLACPMLVVDPGERAARWVGLGMYCASIGLAFVWRFL